MSRLSERISALPIRQLVTFFFGSLAGVTVDLGVFQGLVVLGVLPVFANIVSAAIAITITYFLVTRFTFASKPSFKNYLLFAGWYGVSILAFSVAIQLLAHYTHWNPFVCKLISLPFSFAANFVASRLILGKFKKDQAAGSATAPTQRPARLPRSILGRVAPLVVAWLALLVAGALLYFRVTLQSDSVFLEDLSRDLFSHGGDWQAWRLTPAPAYFPDMVLYFAAYFLFPTVTLRIFAVSFVQVILLGLAVMYVVRQLTSRSRWIAQVIGVALVAIVTLVCSQSTLWLYFYSTNNHFAAVLLPLLGFGLMVSFLRRPRVFPLVALVVFGILGQISTTIYIIAFVAPVILAMVVLWLLFRLFRVGSIAVRRGVLLIAGAVAVGAVLAFPVSALITPSDQAQARLGFSGSLVVRGLSAVLQVAKFIFGGGGPAVMLLGVAVVAALVYLVVQALRRLRPSFGSTDSQLVMGLTVPRYSVESEGGATALGLWIVLWSLPISVAGSVISGGIVDEHGYRYFLFPLGLAGLLATVHLVRTLVERRSWGFTVTTVAAVAVLAVAVALVPSARIPGAASTSAAECLTDLRNSGVSLDAGISDYWDGRGVTLSMDDSPDIVATSGNLDPFYWMTTNASLDDPKQYPRTYDFALLHVDDGGAPWLMNENTLAETLPPPTATYSCGPDLDVWTWDDGSMDKVVKAHFAKWLGTTP